MSNQHIERPGFGVMYHEKDRPKEGWPDYKGFIILKHDYKAGEKLKLGLWIKKTTYEHPLFSLREDDYSKMKRAENQPDKEVHQGYAKVQYRRADDDSDVPF